MNTTDASPYFLMVEDSAIDADLIQSFLDRGGVDCRLTRVETRQQFLDALKGQTPDVILSDFALPDFDGLSALAIAKELIADVPFIFVSGVLGEEVAIDTLTRGATDYVLKKNLGRLPAAIRRALALGQERHERRRAEQAAREAARQADVAREAAESANRAKDEFLAVLSHELRTPLTPILATVQLWQSHRLVPPELREDVDVIRRNVELEARLIDDLLDLTRIARSKLQLDLQPVNLHTLLVQVVEICRSDLEGKSHEWVTCFETTSPVVNGDPTRLHQIFWNLLKNAIKFTPPGGRITVRSFDAPDGSVAVEVADSGIGIAPEMMPRIFAAFDQGDGSVTRRFGGLGLGLAIAKALAEAHSGELRAHSDGPARGATFTVSLPIVERSEPSNAGGGTRPAAAAAGVAGLRILLVEDHADTARIMGKLLKVLGHAAEVAQTVAGAISLVRSQPFDLLISDIGLPDGSGLDVVSQPEAKRMPSIALTGFGMDHDVQRCLDAGFCEHLVKPINFEKLKAVISDLVERWPRNNFSCHPPQGAA